MNARHLSASVLSTLVAVGAIACSPSSEPPAPARTGAWSCGTADVPMGEVVRCTQSAFSGVPAAEGSSTDGEETSYECSEGSSDCPDAESSTTSSSSEEEVESSEPSTEEPSTEEPSTEETGPGKGRGKGAGKSAERGQSAGKGRRGPSECSYCPDLSYCEESSAPKEKSKKYRCSKDGKGNRTCTSAPSCAKGSHPSACGACVSDDDSSGGDCVPPTEGGCWVTGGGFIVGPNAITGAEADGHDNFGGNAKPMKDGRIQGHWNHVDHGTGNHAKGRPEYIVCRHVDEPGPGGPGAKKGFTMNQVYFGGHAEWQTNGGGWESGFWFDVVAKDHGEPGSVPHVKNGQMPDTYHFTIRKVADDAKGVSGALVYETSGSLEGGNIQMHPPNPGHPATASALPPWVELEP